MNIATVGSIGPPHFKSTLGIIREQYRSWDFGAVSGLVFAVTDNAHGKVKLFKRNPLPQIAPSADEMIE